MYFKKQYSKPIYKLSPLGLCNHFFSGVKLLPGILVTGIQRLAED